MFVEDDTEPESMLKFPLLTLSAVVSIKQHWDYYNGLFQLSKGSCKMFQWLFYFFYTFAHLCCCLILAWINADCLRACTLFILHSFLYLNFISLCHSYNDNHLFKSKKSSTIFIFFLFFGGCWGVLFETSEQQERLVQKGKLCSMGHLALRKDFPQKWQNACCDRWCPTQPVILASKP